MGSNKAKLIIIILAVVIIGGFLAYRVSASSFKGIKFENLESSLEDVDYAIVYLGELDDETKEMLKDTIKDTRIQVNTSSVDSLEELNKYLEQYEIVSESTDIYMVYTAGEFDAIIEANVEEWRFKELVRWYFFNEIPASEIAYKVPESYEEYEQLINRNKYTVTVFGYAGCTHCNLYMPHVNNVASKYGIDIYYFDRDADLDLYEDVMDLGLEIPAKCVTNGVATTTRGYFAKPMTLITKKGKTVDCIKGNVKEEELEEMLLKYDIIKETK